MIKKTLTFYVIYYILITIFAFVMVYPLLWLIGSSFKTHQEIFSDMTSLIPKKFTIENYIEGWKGFGGIIFAFYWTWDDFMGPLLYLNKPELYPVALALKAFADPTTITNWGGGLCYVSSLTCSYFYYFYIFPKIYGDRYCYNICIKVIKK
jgi:ABC-type glycerol-3-phosphate transport system permease component